jgi:hypothetical protein
MAGRWAGALFAQSIMLGSANAGEEMPEVSALNRDLPHTFLANRPERAAFARAVAEYCGAVTRTTPTNTPAEDAWLRRELDRPNLGGADRVWASAELARFNLAGHFNDCVDTGKKLLAAQSADDRKMEAYLFVSLAWTFSNESFHEQMARQAGMNDKWYGISWTHAYHTSCLIAAMGAIQSIPVTP